jgi:hypothetical protein
MEELFSCRNCIHNCGQSLTIGPGTGFCLQHESIIWNPENTTCKYLHRKDLPRFTVDEGIREHAAEYAIFPRLATLDTKEPIPQIRYSEKFLWERRQFDPILHSIAQYYKSEPRWILISAFAGGVDGRRLLTHSSMVRHYMDHCGTWASSYRLVLALIEEIDVQPYFSKSELLTTGIGSLEETESFALWDIIYVRLSALQEYGWHAGLEELQWISDTLREPLAEMSWPLLQKALGKHRESWVDLVIRHAIENDGFFSAPTKSEDGYRSEE